MRFNYYYVFMFPIFYLKLIQEVYPSQEVNLLEKNL
jgi:hypothetical protein